VRSAPVARGQAPLVWAIPVRPVPVGPLASPYPVRFAIQPTPLTRQQIAARDGAAIVAGARRMGTGVDPAAVVASMPQVTLPNQGALLVAERTPTDSAFLSDEQRMIQARAAQDEATRAATEEMAANAAFGRRFEGMPSRDLYRAAPTAAEMPAWRAEVDRQSQAFRDGLAARGAAMDAAAAAAAGPAGTPTPVAPVTPPAAPPADMGAFGTMTREELMGVNPANLTREEWTAYDAALTQQLDALKSNGPAWLRDKLRQNGAPAERLTNASTTEMIAMSAQPNKRIIPSGTIAAMPKPPKNNALDKTKLLVRAPTASAPAAA